MAMTADQIKSWQAAKKDLLLPIIYVRGFAMTGSEIDDTTADPFNGFNVGSVLVRTGWTGDAARHIFESPVLRLTQPPFNYRVAFSDGVRGLSTEMKNDLAEWAKLGADADAAGSPPKAIVVIYRYYDVDSQLFGKEVDACMETYGWGLGRLVTDVLNVTKAKGVYLVAHSMGGLVARTFLQNREVLDGRHPRNRKTRPVEALLAKYPELRLEQPEWQAAREAVRQFFTYGTPHNGITGQGGLGNSLLNVVGALPGSQVENFNRGRMLEYLDLGAGPHANSLGDRFDAGRTFCLIGTGAADYPVAYGMSRRLVGQLSDGLVEVDNAYVFGDRPGGGPGDTVLAARAYVRRAHSGPYGMVNSEEGFGNLVRFLFGDVRVDGDLHVVDLDLPPRVEEARQKGKRVRASYSFESFLRVRGETWAMTERLVRDGAAVFRRFDELFPDKETKDLVLTGEEARKKLLHRRIELFSAFLDSDRRVNPERKERIRDREISGTMGLALRTRITVPDYEVEGLLWREDYYEGSSLLDRDLVFLAYEDANGWQLAWGPNSGGTEHLERVATTNDDAETARKTGKAFRLLIPGPAIEFWLPMQENGPPRITVWLRLTARLR
jgi:pimeloyl-ACP methyl ester carboxylesterase